MIEDLLKYLLILREDIKERSDQQSLITNQLRYFIYSLKEMNWNVIIMNILEMLKT